MLVVKWVKSAAVMSVYQWDLIEAALLVVRMVALMAGWMDLNSFE